MSGTSDDGRASEAGPYDEREAVTVRLGARDLERLDRAAERRGVERDVVIAEAIDGFLAREMWSGGFVTPPPMELPRKYPWKPAAFGFGRRRRSGS